MKKRRIIAALLSVFLVIAMLPNVAHAKSDYTFNTELIYDTEVKTIVQFVNSDGTVRENVTNESKKFDSDVASDEAQNYIDSVYNKYHDNGLAGYEKFSFVESGSALKDGEFTIDEHAKSVYYSEQFPLVDGSVVYYDDIDDVINYYIMHCENTGLLKIVKVHTYTITAKFCGGKKLETEQPPAEQPEVTKPVKTTYHTHIQTYGDSKPNAVDGAMSGTSGESKRLENIWIKVEGNPNLGIQYTTHCQTYGWLPWSANGEENGTTGEAKRLEAIKIQLTGADKDKYDVYYRVHAQTYGWLGWAKNGAPSGTAGYAKRLEGIQVIVLPKGAAEPGVNYAGVDAAKGKHDSRAFIAIPGASPVVNYPATQAANPVIPGEKDVNVAYRTHVQKYGWQGWKYNGQMSGTSGEAKRLEGINIKLTNQLYAGDIVYTTHVQKYGWQGKENDPTTWKKNGQMSGTSGEAKRLEAIRIALTGEMAKHYDIYYRVHAQTYGWLGWAKNGEASGTAGYAKRLEGIQIVLVPKGGAAPTNDYGNIVSKRPEAYIKK